MYTFKDGVLSAIAHDLKLGCPSPSVVFDGASVQCDIDPRSLFVEGTMHHGRCAPDGLTDRDKGRIQRTIQKEILCVSHYNRIRFQGQLSDSIVSGRLEIRGQERDIKFGVSRRDTTYTGRVEIRPSRWGIQPYKAFMGAIKLKDRVLIEWSYEWSDD